MAGRSRQDDEKLKRVLDKFIKRRIREIEREDPSYFGSKIIADLILRHLRDVMNGRILEEIECACKNHGNTKAVHKLLDEMQRFYGFALKFLNGLQTEGYQDVAKELLNGLDMDEVPRSCHGDIDKLRGERPAQTNNILDSLRHEQEKEWNSSRTSHGGSSMSTSSINHLPPYATGTVPLESIAMSMTGNQPSANIFSTTGTRDQNFSRNSNHPSDHPPPYSESPLEMVAIGGQTTSYAGAGGDRDFQLHHADDTRLQHAAPGTDNPGYLSDVSCAMISDESDSESTVPKEVGDSEGLVTRHDAIELPIQGTSESGDANSDLSSRPASSRNKSINEPATMSTRFSGEEQPIGKNMGPGQDDGKTLSGSDGGGLPAASVVSEPAFVPENFSISASDQHSNQDSTCNPPGQSVGYSVWTYLGAACALSLGFALVRRLQ